MCHLANKVSHLANPKPKNLDPNPKGVEATSDGHGWAVSPHPAEHEPPWTDRNPSGQLSNHLPHSPHSPSTHQGIGADVQPQNQLPSDIPSHPTPHPTLPAAQLALTSVSAQMSSPSTLSMTSTRRLFLDADSRAVMKLQAGWGGGGSGRGGGRFEVRVHTGQSLALALDQ